MHSHEPVQSPKVNSSAADVIFRSCDGVLFYIHRKNLEVGAEGFPPSEIPTQDEVVDLMENSETLELLFQFTYPQRHPTLDTTPFPILEALAEAAEKYQVFAAMNICHILAFVHAYPMALAQYAAKHDYPSLLCDIAPTMISLPLEDVVPMLPPHLILAWIRYVHEWTKVLQHALFLPYGCDRYSTNIYCTNGKWPVCAFVCVSRLGGGVHMLRRLENVFELSCVSGAQAYCNNDLGVWKRRIENAISRIPKFSSFV
ncbi:hypothetical protein B0H14DRAFT_3006360 [Mycena olivaceomarginata]|nr:hypothetical protein B0H14DRAFT_3006360 [Mycena olivaceomarginata]